MPPKNQDTADELAMEPLDAAIEAIELKGGGALVASIVAELLDCWRHLPKPYAQATNGQQQDVFRRFETLALAIVGQTAEKVAAHDAGRSVTCVVGKASIDSEIKVDLKVAPMVETDRDPAILFLAHARGKRVVLKMASADEYDTEPAHDPSEADQSDLGFEAGGDERPIEEPSLESAEG